jgi:hypothetical protein
MPGRPFRPASPCGRGYQSPPVPRPAAGASQLGLSRSGIEERLDGWGEQLGELESWLADQDGQVVLRREVPDDQSRIGADVGDVPFCVSG